MYTRNFATAAFTRAALASGAVMAVDRMRSESGNAHRGESMMTHDDCEAGASVTTARVPPVVLQEGLSPIAPHGTCASIRMPIALGAAMPIAS